MAFNVTASQPVGGFNVGAAKPVVVPGSREDVEANAPGWTSAFGAAPSAALKTIKKIPGALNWMMENPIGYKLPAIAAAIPGALADEVGDATQYIRNLSPPEFRGSAPSLGTGLAKDHPYLEAMQGASGGVRTAIATAPLGVAADILGAASNAPVGEAIGAAAQAAKAADRVGGAALRATVGRAADLLPLHRAENQLLEAARTGGRDPEAVARALETRPINVPGIDLSAGQTTLDPHIAELEKTSRQRSGANWLNFDTTQGSSLYDAMHGIVSPYNDAAVGAANTARSQATDWQREMALRLAEQRSLEPGAVPDALERLGAPVHQTIEEGLAGRFGGTPGAQATANEVRRGMLEGTEPAARLYEKRKYLADALNAKAGVPLSEQAAAAKSAGAFSRNIRNSIDASLDAASGGEWRRYITAFREHSADVNSAEALNNIRIDLEKALEGGKMRDANGNPMLTRASINQIIERHASNKFGPTIAPDIQARLDAVRDAAARIETGKRALSLAQTGGAGSDTIANGLTLLKHGAHLADIGTGGVGTGLSVLRAIGSLGENHGATRLAELLQNPPEAATALRRAIARDRARSLSQALQPHP